MLQVKPVSPQNIMAVTFTNKAAGEMKKRLESKLGKDMAEKVYAKTFHSACVGILREYAMFVGFKRDFTIYDEKDCKSVLKDIYKANGIKEKELHKDDVLNHISIWKDKMITPDMAISQSTISSYNTVAHLYKEYQERLKNANAMDFDDLIGNTIQLLKEHPDIQAELQKKIQYIMVDEYQDTNASQHELLSLLVSPEHNICVVGDDDQSIYSFRGADVDNILNFPQEFDGTHIIKMEQNYRSDGNILNLANSLIGHNTKRHNKNLWTYRNPGVMPTYTYYASDYDETDSIGKAPEKDDDKKDDKKDDTDKKEDSGKKDETESGTDEKVPAESEKTETTNDKTEATTLRIAHGKPALFTTGDETGDENGNDVVATPDENGGKDDTEDPDFVPVVKVKDSVPAISALDGEYNSGVAKIQYYKVNGSAIAKSADGDYTFDETKFETVNVTSIDKDNGYVTFKLSPDWTGYIVTRTVDKAGNYGDVRVASVKLENPPEESRPTPTPVVKNEPAPTPAPVVVNYKTGVGFGAEVIVPVIVVVALIGVGAFVIVKKKNGDSEEKAAEKPEDKTEEKKQ